MTHEEAFEEINNLQDEYINQLISLMNNKDYSMMQMINFTSPTGTGKTNMMAKLINKFPSYYFIITTLSKGQLHLQIRANLEKLCNQNNFYVYGSADYKINSKLDAQDIISKIPENTKCIWLRDEGHIRTNRWDELLLKVCYKVINFSATNTYSDIQCNFTSTMMLRTVNQTNGTPEDAINKLLEIKEAHKNVPNYNPCAIFRCVSGDIGLYKMIVDLCNKNHLKYIDITEDEFIMNQLCEDNNEYDVIINKFKIVEGIDIRRAHVLYMDNQPGNNATTIQVIGRCRRNALLYRKDIDIMSSENENLLNQTRECYVYYNVEKMKVDEDENGELQYAFCNHVSCQSLKAGSEIYVKNGQLDNGLYIIELVGQTGKFKIEIDSETGFNIVNPITNFYNKYETKKEDYIYITTDIARESTVAISRHIKECYKIQKDNLKYLPVSNTKHIYDWSIGGIKDIQCDPYYDIRKYSNKENISYIVSKDILDYFDLCSKDIQSYIDNITSLESLQKKIKINKKKIETFINQYNSNDKDLHKILRESLRNTDYFEYKVDRNLDIIKYFYIQKQQEGYSDEQLVEYFHKIFKIIHHIEIEKTYESSAKDFKSFNEEKTLYLLCNNENIYNIDLTMNTEYMSYYLVIDYGILPTDQMIIESIKKFFEKIKYKSIHQICSNISWEKAEKHRIKDIILDCKNKLKQNQLTIIYSYISLYTPLSKEESMLIKNGTIKPLSTIPLNSELLKPIKAYKKIMNDKESAVIGVDLMKQSKDDNDNIVWIESRSVSSKIGNYNKFNTFISNRYNKELEQAKSQYVKGKNDFVLDKKCNSIIGYCVEYYSKYLVYGEKYLANTIEKAKDESKTDQISTPLIVRACMLKYKEMMVLSFGSNVSKIIKTISTEQLIKEKYRDFVNLVVKLGTETANFVRDTLYKNVSQPINNIDPNLSIKHIAGLADYITEDTILDVKVNGNLNEGQIRQVLAYHYLSTKRSDLNIKRVIVYDATSGKHVSIDISPENWKKNQPYGYKN